MASANDGAQIAASIESSGVTFALTNEIAIKLCHEDELLQRPYSELVKRYLPNGSVVPVDDDHLESRFEVLSRCAESR